MAAGESESRRMHCCTVTSSGSGSGRFYVVVTVGLSFCAFILKQVPIGQTMPSYPFSN